MRSYAPGREVEGAPRRCTCGGVIGPTGECEACRAKRLAPSRASEGLGRRRERAPTTARRGHDFGAISVERKPGIAHGPAGPRNEFDDCPSDWQTRANAAQRRGARWVDNAIVGLSNLPAPIPAPVEGLLQTHFHTSWDRDLRKIVSRYLKISRALSSSIGFECETECDPGVRAYVYSVWTDVHLCPDWFNAGPADRAKSVVHELAHDAADCDDNAYFWEAKYNRLSVDEAMDNADSYAVFAREAFGE